jgi:hypothetical protein
MNAEAKTKELRPNARLLKESRPEIRYIDYFMVLEEGIDNPILGTGDTAEAAWSAAALRINTESADSQIRSLERQVANLEAQLS